MLWMTRARSPLVVGPRIKSGAQGAVFEAKVGDTLFALKWLSPREHVQLVRQSISALIEHPRPHRAFVWPIDLVTGDDLEGFGYLMEYMSPRFSSFSRVIEQRPKFRSLIRMALDLVDAFAALHASGLCYRDISFRNLFVDPETCEVAICDNDNVGVDSGIALVRGTNEFMAPEILRNEVMPRTATDLYSLAVFLHLIFVRGHPLDGKMTEAIQKSAGGSSDAVWHSFAASPIFAFDPDNDMNLPSPGDPRLVYWPIYPRFFRSLFVKSFTTGLADPTVSGRVTATGWRRGLERLMDSWNLCKCGAEVFWDPEDPSYRCWNCTSQLERPHTLEVTGRVIVLCEGTVIGSGRILYSEPGGTEFAGVERDPEVEDSLVVRNKTAQTWIVKPDEEGPKWVVPTQRVRIRPMTLDFGEVRGRIT
jgi:eukaryotic-like serine/threonine-protein kinase